MQMISQRTVDALKHDSEQSHEVFSKAHAQYSEAEEELARAAGVRSNLVRNLDIGRKALSDAMQKAVQAAIANAGFEEAAAEVLALDNEVRLRDVALRRYHAFQYADTQRATLAARVLMLELQHSAEKARLAAHVAEIEVGLSAVAMKNGGVLEVQTGGATRGHEELIARIGRDAEEAREALRNHDAETLELRGKL
jgi:hypothetical protein